MTTGPEIYGDAVVACADLVGRSGASDFEIGYLHDNVPTEEAGWYASAHYRGARITVQDHRSPTGAAMAMAERLLRDAACRCHRPVVMTDDADGCRWRLVGQRWESACDAPPIRVQGQRGDIGAMRQAYTQSLNRADRRAASRKGARS